MENTTIIFKWKTGKIELLPERLVDYSVSTAELKKLFNIATENREEVQEQVREYLTGKYAELDPEALKHEGKALSSYGEKKRKHIKSLLSIFEDRKHTKQERALSKIVKSCAKNRPDFSGVFQDAGKFCVSDGYLLIRCASPVSGLTAAARTIDTAKAIGNIADYTVSLQLPTIKELKADIKIAKNGVEFGRYHIEYIGRKIFVLYDFGYGLPLVNAEYLLTMLEALPDCEAFAVPSMTSHPVYFRSGNDDGILLPVRKDCEYEEPPVEESAAIPAAAETTEAAQTVKTAQPVTEEEKPKEDAREAAQADQETKKAAAVSWYNPREENAFDAVQEIAKAFTDTIQENADTVQKRSAGSLGSLSDSLGGSAVGSLSADIQPRPAESIPRPPWARGEYLVVFGKMPLLPLLLPSRVFSASSVSSASFGGTLSAISFCSLSALEYSRQSRPP